MHKEWLERKSLGLKKKKIIFLTFLLNFCLWLLSLLLYYIHRYELTRELFLLSPISSFSLRISYVSVCVLSSRTLFPLIYRYYLKFLFFQVTQKPYPRTPTDSATVFWSLTGWKILRWCLQIGCREWERNIYHPSPILLLLGVSCRCPWLEFISWLGSVTCSTHKNHWSDF